MSLHNPSHNGHFKRAAGAFLMYAWLVLTICAPILLVYWYLQPAPVDVGSYTRTILTPIVRPGDSFRVRVDVTWNKECYSRLSRYIIDSQGRVYTFDGDARKNFIGHQEFVISQVVPDEVSPGTANWRVVTDWFCNPAQMFFPNTVRLPDLPFTILEKQKE